jgi:RHS repeat-associated protein
MNLPNFPSRFFRQLHWTLRVLSVVAGILPLLFDTYSSATTLGAQWRKLPAETAKPESGSASAPKPITGGSGWVQATQDPAYAPVTFSGQFWAEGVVHASLGGVTVSGTNDDGICTDYVETTPATVYLKLYQTYDFTLSGQDVYLANGNLSAPSVLDLFSSRTIGLQPERLYKLYIWVPDVQKWEILCSANAPAWNQDACMPMTATFKIQVRPDLGARPVTRPGVMPSNGSEQADDSWTRAEPAIDCETAPGDAEPVKMSSSRQGDPSTVRFQWDVSLGRLWSGAGAGRLRIDESRLTTNVYTPASLSYGPPAAETNELCVLMDLDYTNWLAQVYTPQTLATIEQVYGSALLSTNDLLAVRTLVIQLTNHTDLVSGYLWTNFTATGRQTLTNTNSTLPQLASTLSSELNTILQGPSIYNLNRFSGVSLMGRTKRLLLLNPTGADLVRLNRFLVEDTYSGEINRLASTLFAVNFYLPSQVGPLDSLGFFTLVPGASSFVRWQIGLPPGGTNQWQVQEVRNGATNVTLLSWAPATGCWTLTEGSGADARIETRTIVSNVVAGVTNAIETQQVSNGAGAVSDRTTEVYRQFDWGYEVVTVTNDPGGANLVTRFTFNTDANDQATFGKIASVTYPDGFWEQRVYSKYTDSTQAPYGTLIRIIQPWENSSTNDLTHNDLVTDYNYGQGGPGSYAIQKWHGAETNFSYTLGPDDYDPYLSRNCSAVYEEETFMYLDTCADSQGVVNEGRQLGNLQHYGSHQFTSSYTPFYGRSAGQLYSKADEIGTVDSYDYEFGVWDPAARTFTDFPQAATDHDVRQTIFHGSSYTFAPIWDQLTTGPSGNAIEPVIMVPNRSTEEIRVIQGGNLVAKELYVYQGNFTSFALVEQIIYQRDCLGHATNVFRVDPGTGQSRVIYRADWRGNQAWPTDLKLSESDQTGAVTNYTYDSLKRVKTQTLQPGSGQSALVTTLSYDSAGRVLTNLVSGGTLSQQTVTLYDVSDRVIQQITPQLLSTRYSYQNGGQQTTVTEPSGAISTIAKYLDRRLASIVGTAVTNQFFAYSQNWSPTFNIIQAQNVATVTFGSSNALRWSASVTDTRYQPAGSQEPAFNDTNNIVVLYLFGQAGLVDGVQTTAINLDNAPPDPYDPYRGMFQPTHYTYDEYGQRITQATPDPAANPYYAVLDFASNERITTWTNFYQQDGQGTWFHVSEQWSYPYSNDATATLVERTKIRLTGFASTGVSETQQLDADTNQTTIQVSVDLANKKVTAVTTVAQSSLSATQVVVNGLLQSQSTTTVSSPAQHYYDSLRRETGVRDSLGNLTQTQYDPVTGQVTATINAQGLRTAMAYYPPGGHAAGLLKSQTGPTGRSTYYDYNDRGQTTYIWGDVPYPEKREYNQLGDQTTLTTYRSGTGWYSSTWPPSTGPGDATTWYFDEATGLLTNKTDAAGQPVKFDYYNTHQLRTRVWARGVGTTNIYRANGDFVRIDYSDGTSVKFTDDDFPYLNRLAKPSVIHDNAGTSELAYDFAGRLRATTYAAGLLAGITVTNHLNPVYGRDLLQVLSSNATPSTIYSAGYGFDNYGRMGTVSSGVYSAAYGYVPSSDLLQTTTCKNNGSTVLTTTRAWDYGYRLRSIANVANGATVTSHSYSYDWLDRRIQATLEDGSVWKYNYNDRNELIGAHRYWSDWTPVAGQQYGYDYDNIGNRNSASSGGDTTGANLRTTSYTANSLNQYTSVSTPGYEPILGAALANNSVTINSGAADRKGEYFHREISVANGSGPVWQNASVTSGGVTTNGGCAFPASNQTLTYDLDGNLTFDGIWTYEWDPENRLAAMSMTNVAGIANSNRLRLEFVYDFLGRRVSKTVKSWNGSFFASPATTLFVCDSWNLLTALNPSLNPVMAFMWGRDLGGTMDKAGGVGGLLMSSFCGASQTNCFVSYDGNGNLTALVNAADGTLAARYEYSPYGETLRATGPMAKRNPFRFSTKLADEETGLTDYGRRYYMANLGRWASRDTFNPKLESPFASLAESRVSPPLDSAWDAEYLPGGLNLYGFVNNSPVSGIDGDGRFLLLDFFFTSGYLINDLRTRQAAVFAAIAGPLARRLYEGAIFVPAAVTQLAIVGGGMAYQATMNFLLAHPTFAYEFGVCFTTTIGWQPGPPTPGSWGSEAGFVFNAWLDYVTDPSTP